MGEHVEKLIALAGAERVSGYTRKSPKGKLVHVSSYTRDPGKMSNLDLFREFRLLGDGSPKEGLPSQQAVETRRAQVLTEIRKRQSQGRWSTRDRGGSTPAPSGSKRVFTGYSTTEPEGYSPQPDYQIGKYSTTQPAWPGGGGPSGPEPEGYSDAPGPKSEPKPGKQVESPELDSLMEAHGSKGKKDATGELNDPIDCGGDVLKAAAALSEGKHVRLNRVDEVGTLLDELNKVVAEAIEKGEDAPVFDLCKVSVPKTNLFCVDEKTEILTGRGWQRHDQITVGEQVLTLDHATGLSRWEPLLAVNLFDPEYRHVLEISGRVHSSLTTLEHRWPVVTSKRKGGLQRGWTTSGAGFKWDDAVPLSAPHADYPMEAKYSDSFVALVSWAWTEGTFTGGRGFRIYQSATKNFANVERIRGVLTSLYGPARENHGSFRPSSVARRGNREAIALPAWRETILEETGMVSFHLNQLAAEPLYEVMDSDKAVRTEFLCSLTEAQLHLYVETALAGDGWAVGGSRFLGQRIESRARSFEVACALLGIPTHTTQVEDRRAGHEGKSTYVVTLATRNVVKPKNLHTEVKFYDGLVWCPTTPSGTWLARREGSVFFTGNCAESKGIPRTQMPQFGGEALPNTPAAELPRNKKGEVNIETQFEEELRARGVKIEEKDVPAAFLKASQAELDGPKVAGMSRAMEAGKVPDAPIFVTRDGYIIDGHHRWASKVAIDAKDGNLGDIQMPVRMLDMDIGEALDFANTFAKAMGIKPKGLGAAAEGVVEGESKKPKPHTALDNLRKRAASRSRNLNKTVAEIQGR